MSLTKDQILTKIRAMREGFYSETAQKIEQRISGNGEEDLTYSKLRAAQDGHIIARLQEQINTINNQTSDLNSKINEITQSRASALLDVESEEFQKNLSPQQKQRVALLKREREDLQYFYQRSQLVNVLEAENQKLTKQLHEMQVQLAQACQGQPQQQQNNQAEVEELEKAKKTIEEQNKRIKELEEQLAKQTTPPSPKAEEKKQDGESRSRRKKESSGDAPPSPDEAPAAPEGGERRRRKKTETQE